MIRESAHPDGGTITTRMVEEAIREPAWFQLA
jgi:hypothetical protein